MGFVLSYVTSLLQILQIWTLYSAYVLGLSYKSVKLFTTNVATWTESQSIASLSEANFPGYVPQAVTTLFGPSLDPVSGNANLFTNGMYWQVSGPGTPNTIYCAALCGPIVGGVAATLTVTEVGGAIATVTIVTPGSGYLAAPFVTISGAPGVNAVIALTLTAGAVTGATIINPGSGYVAPTAVVEPPVEVLQGGVLPSPAPMQATSDGLNLTLDLINFDS